MAVCLACLQRHALLQHGKTWYCIHWCHCQLFNCTVSHKNYITVPFLAFLIIICGIKGHRSTVSKHSLKGFENQFNMFVMSSGYNKKTGRIQSLHFKVSLCKCLGGETRQLRAGRETLITHANTLDQLSDREGKNPLRNNTKEYFPADPFYVALMRCDSSRLPAVVLSSTGNPIGTLSVTNALHQTKRKHWSMLSNQQIDHTRSRQITYFPSSINVLQGQLCAIHIPNN